MERSIMILPRERQRQREKPRKIETREEDKEDERKRGDQSRHKLFGMKVRPQHFIAILAQKHTQVENCFRMTETGSLLISLSVREELVRQQPLNVCFYLTFTSPVWTRCYDISVTWAGRSAWACRLAYVRSYNLSPYTGGYCFTKRFLKFSLLFCLRRYPQMISLHQMLCFRDQKLLCFAYLIVL